MLSFFDPFALLVALVPIIGYVTLLALIRISGSAVITSAARDTAALGLAISGLVAVGPGELFFPSAAATAFGPLVWLILLGLYALCITLISLTAAPKLIAYGRTQNELFQPLLNATRRIDPESEGDTEKMQIFLPNAGIRLRLTGHRSMDCAQVLAFEPNVSSAFWKRLMAHLRAEVAGTAKPMPRRGFGMLTFAICMSGLLLWQCLGKQTLVVDGFRDWLWR